MRIAYVVTRGDAVGGATVHVLEMASAMLSRGHDALVLIGGEGPSVTRLIEAKAPVRCLRFLRRSIRPDLDALALVELIAALRSFRPGLVSTHTAKAGFIGRAACAALGIPAIHTPHGLPFGDRMPGLAGAVFLAAERLAGRWPGAIVCVCEHERRLAMAHSIAPAERLFVVPNGVRSIPEELGADAQKEPPGIVSVARFEPPKDHSTLLRALALLRGLDWRLELVGDGPRMAASRVLAERLGIGGRVRFSGYLADIAPALASAQIFALSSRSEALPRSIIEAMRAGLPVVASGVGGTPEIVDNGVNGLLVSPGNAAALAAALGDLVGNAPRRKQFGAAARHTFESRFRLECMIERTVAIYNRVLGDDASQ